MSDAHVFAALVDTLIPGDELFPAASIVGTQYWVLDHLRSDTGGAGIDQTLAALGSSFAELPEAERTAALAELEQTQPALFALLRQLTCFGYYQNALVVRAVRALGIVYNDAPQPEGYDLGEFEPAVHLPQVARGHFVPTDQVQRVSLPGSDVDVR